MKKLPLPLRTRATNIKLIIIEGGDNLGKSTLIEGLCQHFKYDNITLRHFDKPPKGMSPKETLDFQFNCFNNEISFLHAAQEIFTYTYNYYPNIFIWNRSHVGEYVYGQMFRGSEQKEILDSLLTFEFRNLYYMGLDTDTYLITHIADPEFFFKNEDGDSYAKTLEDKTKELKLFKEIHELSTIKHKLLLKVDINGEWRSKEDMLNEVLNFIQ